MKTIIFFLIFLMPLKSFSENININKSYYCQKLLTYCNKYERLRKLKRNGKYICNVKKTNKECKRDLLFIYNKFKK